MDARIGSWCWAKIPVEKTDGQKLTERARLCRFLGYGPGRIYRLWDVEESKVIESTMVRFDELATSAPRSSIILNELNEKEQGYFDLNLESEDEEVESDKSVPGTSGWEGDEERMFVDVEEGIDDDEESQPSLPPPPPLRRSARLSKPPGECGKVKSTKFTDTGSRVHFAYLTKAEARNDSEQFRRKDSGH